MRNISIALVHVLVLACVKQWLVEAISLTLEATCTGEQTFRKYKRDNRENHGQLKYVKLYMAAEQGSIKEHFDGTNKSWEEFEFDTVNSTTYKCMTGKSEHERDAAAAVL